METGGSRWLRAGRRPRGVWHQPHAAAARHASTPGSLRHTHTHARAHTHTHTHKHTHTPGATSPSVRDSSSQGGHSGWLSSHTITPPTASHGLGAATKYQRAGVLDTLRSARVVLTGWPKGRGPSSMKRGSSVHLLGAWRRRQEAHAQQGGGGVSAATARQWRQHRRMRATLCQHTLAPWPCRVAAHVRRAPRLLCQLLHLVALVPVARQEHNTAARTHT
jgi:hypothetical protein